MQLPANSLHQHTAALRHSSSTTLRPAVCTSQNITTMLIMEQSPRIWGSSKTLSRIILTFPQSDGHRFIQWTRKQNKTKRDQTRRNITRDLTAKSSTNVTNRKPTFPQLANQSRSTSPRTPLPQRVSPSATVSTAAVPLFDRKSRDHLHLAYLMNLSQSTP